MFYNAQTFVVDYVCTSYGLLFIQTTYRLQALNHKIECMIIIIKHKQLTSALVQSSKTRFVLCFCADIMLFHFYLHSFWNIYPQQVHCSFNSRSRKVRKSQTHISFSFIVFTKYRSVLIECIKVLCQIESKISDQRW